MYMSSKEDIQVGGGTTHPSNTRFLTPRVYIPIITSICSSVFAGLMITTNRHTMLLYSTHTHRFNGPLSRTTRVSQYQKSKTNPDFTEARDSEWPWDQLGHMQVCTSLQTDNHASTPPLSFYKPDALPAAQPTASKH